MLNGIKKHMIRKVYQSCRTMYGVLIFFNKCTKAKKTRLKNKEM